MTESDFASLIIRAANYFHMTGSYKLDILHLKGCCVLTLYESINNNFIKLGTYKVTTKIPSGNVIDIANAVCWLTDSINIYLEVHAWVEIEVNKMKGADSTEYSGSEGNRNVEEMINKL